MDYLINATLLLNCVGETIREHPTAFIVGGTLATASITGPLLLGTIGFSAAGPVAASLAASWQSSIGMVQAGSLFSALQGAGMGGAAAGVFTSASTMGVGILGTTVCGARCNISKAMPFFEAANIDLDQAGFYDEDQQHDEYVMSDSLLLNEEGIWYLGQQEVHETFQY